MGNVTKPFSSSKAGSPSGPGGYSVASSPAGSRSTAARAGAAAPAGSQASPLPTGPRCPLHILFLFSTGLPYSPLEISLGQRSLRSLPTLTLKHPANVQGCHLTALGAALGNSAACGTSAFPGSCSEAVPPLGDQVAEEEPGSCLQTEARGSKYFSDLDCHGQFYVGHSLQLLSPIEVLPKRNLVDVIEVYSRLTLSRGDYPSRSRGPDPTGCRG